MNGLSKEDDMKWKQAEESSFCNLQPIIVGAQNKMHIIFIVKLFLLKYGLILTKIFKILLQKRKINSILYK